MFRQLLAVLVLEQLLQILGLLQRQRRQMTSDNGPHGFNPPPFMIGQLRPVRQNETIILAPGHLEKIARRAVRERVVRVGSV